MSDAELLLRNLRPWGESKTIDLAVIDGRFVAPGPDGRAKRTIDAGGRLAVPGFIEPHIHLDKVMINKDVRTNRSGTLTEKAEKFVHDLPLLENALRKYTAG